MKGIVSTRSIVRLVISAMLGGIVALSSVQAGDRGNWHDGRGHDGRGGLHQRNAGQLNQRNENVDRRYFKRHRDRYRSEASRRYHQRSDARRDFVGRDRRHLRHDGQDGPFYVPNIGSYAGSMSAYRDPGNGIYFNIDRDEGYERRRSRSRVIVVEPGYDTCSYEAGVCIVRP